MRSLVLFLCASLAGPSLLARGPQPPTVDHHIPPPTEPIDAVECYLRVKDTTFLNNDQATRLCRCAHTSARLNCYLRGKDNTFLNDEQLIMLCAGRDTLMIDLQCDR